MKQLVLIRHAKSSWSDPALADRDRPLNKRGLRDAPRMGLRLVERFGDSSISIISSPALRAKSTAHILAGELGVAESDVVLKDFLYHAEVEALMRAVETLDDSSERVLLVGHNPGLTDFASELCGKAVKWMPTCGIVALNFDVDSWVDVQLGRGQLDWLDCPKRPGQL